MSAHLCSAYEIGRLSAYLAAKDGPSLKYHAEGFATAKGSEAASLVAAKLATANVASIQECYPDTRESFEGAPGVVAEVADGVTSFIALCAQAGRLSWRSDHRPSEMIQACDHFSYQACEYEGWKDSEAFALVRLAKDRATRELLTEIGQDGGWGLSEEESSRPAGISVLDL